MLLLLLACSGVSPKDTSEETALDSAATDSADTSSDSADTSSDTSDTSGDTGTPPGPVTCGLTPAEDWWWDGECPQMGTPVHIAVEGCALTLTYPSAMTMGMPYSGVIEGSDVTFADDGDVPGCVGVIEDPDHISGTCASGCTYTLARGAPF